jgi:cytochrome P450 family 135
MAGKVSLPGSPLPAPLQAALFVADAPRFLRGNRRRYGPNFRLKMPIIGDVAYLSDPAAIKQVFTGGSDLFHAGEGNVMLRPLLGRHSLLLLDEDEHLAHRRMLLPPFHGDRVRRYAETVRALAAAEVETWPRGEALAMHPRMQRITLGVIMRAVIGVRDDERAAELGRLLQRLLGDMTAWDMVLFSAWPGAADSRIGRRLPQLRMLARVDELIYEEIARHRAEPGDDVLSVLIAARDEDGRGLDDTELRDELVTLLVAGHETTATGLAWCFEALVRHPDVLRRVRDDPADDAYLDAVCKETLRVRPVVPDVARRVTRTIELGGGRVEAGATVWPAILLTHLHAYDDALAFRPERFLDTRPGTYTWLPFGGGPRRCVGAAFALMEMREVLRTVLEHVDVEAVERAPERARIRHVTLVPAKGGLVRVRTRATAQTDSASMSSALATHH